MNTVRSQNLLLALGAPPKEGDLQRWIILNGVHTAPDWPSLFRRRHRGRCPSTRRRWQAQAVAVLLCHWVNTVLCSTKNSIGGTCHAFGCGTYVTRYLGAIAYRLIRRFALHALPNGLLMVVTVNCQRCERWIRTAETHC